MADSGEARDGKREHGMQLTCKVLVIGAGLAGIGSAIGLKKAGINDFVMLEKEQEVGGTWRDHDYPGLTVDISTSIYSFSYEPNPDWSRFFAPRAELFEYAKHCASKYGLYEHIRFGKEVEKAVFDEQANVWRVHCLGGEVLVSRYLITATGFLNVVKFPDIPGLDRFKGRKIHSSHWKRDTEVKGERVGFIGTGATAIQLIPELAPHVSRMDVYQRTPIWLLPKNDAPVGPRLKWAMKHIPGFIHLVRLQNSLLFDYVIIAGALNYGGRIAGFKPFEKLYKSLEKSAIAHVQAQVQNPDLREALIPKYSLGCKRLSFSDKYYLVFNQKNVELVTNPIKEVTADGIVTADGTERKIDTLICATGYEVYTKDSPPTIPIFGVGGQELRNFWHKNRFQAYRGVSITGFPNYFIINGPYSVSHASYIAMVEDEIHHIIRCIKEGDRRGASRVEVKAESMRRDFESCINNRGKTVFFSASCANSNSYYVDQHGDVPTFRPSNRMAAWIHSRTFNLDHYAYDASVPVTSEV